MIPLIGKSEICFLFQAGFTLPSTGRKYAFVPVGLCRGFPCSAPERLSPCPDQPAGQRLRVHGGLFMAGKNEKHAKRKN